MGFGRDLGGMLERDARGIQGRIILQPQVPLHFYQKGLFELDGVYT